MVIVGGNVTVLVFSCFVHGELIVECQSATHSYLSRTNMGVLSTTPSFRALNIFHSYGSFL